MDSTAIIIAILGTLGGSGGLFYFLSTIVNKKLEKQTKATEAQTNQNKLVGKLRIALERLDTNQAKAHHEFLITLAEAYSRGNDKEKVKKMTDEMKKQRKKFTKVEDEIQDAIISVYDEKISEEEVNAVISASKELAE
jgi:hypothetical protein